jgi:hypothetical protein
MRPPQSFGPAVYQQIGLPAPNAPPPPLGHPCAALRERGIISARASAAGGFVTARGAAAIRNGRGSVSPLLLSSAQRGHQ